MADIRGTAGKDVVTVRSGQTYYAEAGDDELTLEDGATAQGMAGNDRITVAPGVKWATVWYWDSPSTIYVDMEAGYALDGHGTRDTLVNVHIVHGFSRNGDKGYGTSGEDYFYLGSNWQRQPGTVYIDGRAGLDQVSMGYNPSDNFGEVVLKVSADGRLVTLYNANNPNFVYELHNIERFDVWNNATQTNKEYDLAALRDVSRAGEEILLRGNKGWQTQANGTPLTLTYGFLTQAPAQGGEGGAGFTAYTDAQKQTVRDVFYLLQQQTGLAFAEVAGEAAQVRLGINQQASTRGYAFIPDAYRADARAGDVWLDLETASLMSPGQEGYYVLLHELAHALGLQHPLSEADTSGATVLLNSVATASHTLMVEMSASSSSSSSASGVSWPTWFGGFDMQALRALYGTRAFASGDNVYAVSDASRPLSIFDDGGLDTLDASQASVSASIDLRPGKSSSIGMAPDGKASVGNVSIASGTVIENVVGTPYDDVILGNAANNTITFSGGNDIVDGDEGVDVFRVWGSSSSVSIFKDAPTGYWSLDSTNRESGSSELRNVERVYFTDIDWALDTGDAQSAARTAKILGAVFGKEGLANMAYRGIGLFYFDNGMSYEALTLLALDARVGPGASKDAVAQLLQSNVPGLAVNPGAYASTTAMAMYAQESALNKAMVDVVGLATAGMPYQFWG